MMRNADEQSFSSISFNQLMHPEIAEATIDRRYLNESPWTTVYYEAVAGPGYYEGMPVAVGVVAVDEDNDDIEEANSQQPQEIRHRQGEAAPLGTSIGPQSQQQQQQQQPHTPVRPKPWQHSNLIDLILGFSMTLAAFLCTIKIELTAIIIYTIAAGFHYIAEEVFSPAPLLLGKSICLTVCNILMIVDPILLTVSVILTEILGGIALLICTIFGGPRSGHAWHQFIRRTCHLTRWGFRSCHKGWKPERVFPLSMEDERNHLESCATQENGNDGLELSSSQVHRYADAATSVTCSCGTSPPCPSCCTQETVPMSEIAFAGEASLACPMISIAAENVSLIHDDDDDNNHIQGDVTMKDEIFKNTQRVVMT